MFYHYNEFTNSDTGKRLLKGSWYDKAQFLYQYTVWTSDDFQMRMREIANDHNLTIESKMDTNITDIAFEIEALGSPFLKINMLQATVYVDSMDELKRVYKIFER